VKVIGAIAGAGLGVVAIWGALEFAKSGHPILSFLCGAGGVGAGANIAYASITGKSPWEQIRIPMAQGSGPSTTQDVGEGSVSG
jgi:hypothetical protein